MISNLEINKMLCPRNKKIKIVSNIKQTKKLNRTKTKIYLMRMKIIKWMKNLKIMTLRKILIVGRSNIMKIIYSHNKTIRMIKLILKSLNLSIKKMIITNRTKL